MSLKKSLIRLMRIPTEMRIGEVVKILNFVGYELVRIQGSHFQFYKNHRGIITIPVHNQKVGKIYLKMLKGIIVNELNL